MGTIELYEQYVLKNYAPPPLDIVRGEGSWVWDGEGNKYLDFTTGVAVNSIGHSHPLWTSAIMNQARILGHCSNLFAHPRQAQLAKKLTSILGKGELFFCNSGAEATETLIKLARLHGKNSGRFEIITAKNSFHGRTFGGMSATGQEKTQAGFHPLVPGFVHAEFNNLDSFKDALTDKTSSILIETIQGEGGIHPATPEFMLGLRKLCDDNRLLLLVDEIQCGVGRAGEWFAFQPYGIPADAVAMAKGLGGGFPIGAAWMSPATASLFQPGSHGSTFGGNPLACAAALAVLEVIEDEGLLAKVRELSAWYLCELENLVKEFPDILLSVRGKGFLLGMVLADAPAPLLARLRENGLLTVPAAGNVLRLLPPLNVKEGELQTSLDILQKTLSSPAS